MNLMGQGIPLGRWFGIRVQMHWLFVAYAIFRIVQAGTMDGFLFIVMLFGTVLLHEFGHSLTCKAVGGRADYILLWPLGGLAFVDPPPRPWPQLLVTIGGPAVNFLLIPFFILLQLFLLPLVPKDSSLHEMLAYLTSYGILINLFLLCFNLLPVFPMDGGRIVQEVLWFFIGYPKSLLVAGMIGTVGGVAFIFLGLGLTSISLPIPFPNLAHFTHHDPAWFMIIPYAIGETGQQDFMLIAIGAMAAMNSYGTYKRAQEVLNWRRN